MHAELEKVSNIVIRMLASISTYTQYIIKEIAIPLYG